MRVIETARDAPNLASTLNQGAFNVGNAAGAWIGGLALSAGVSYQNLPLVGAATAVVRALRGIVLADARPPGGQRQRTGSRGIASRRIRLRTVRFAAKENAMTMLSNTDELVVGLLTAA